MKSITVVPGKPEQGTGTVVVGLTTPHHTEP